MVSFWELSTISHIRPQLTFGGSCSSCCTDLNGLCQTQQQLLMGWNIFWERKNYKEREKHPLAPANNFYLPTALPRVSNCKQEVRSLEIPSERN